MFGIGLPSVLVGSDGKLLPEGHTLVLDVECVGLHSNVLLKGELTTD